MTMTFNPSTDLEFCREVDIPVAAIWEGWTSPTRLMQWFCPHPWQVVECDIDLRAGGRFRTVMQSPQGERMPAFDGCYLQVEPQRRLVWTNALGADYRPNVMPAAPQEGPPTFQFVADLQFDALPSGGSRYRAIVRHADAASRQAHENMGFEQGWGIALDQLVELVKAPHPKG